MSALQHLGQMVLVSGCLWIQSLTLFLFSFFPCLQTMSSVSTDHRENFHMESPAVFLYC